MAKKYLKCSVCGQIVEVVKETGAPIICCGKPMETLVAGTTDASVEKHVPQIKQENGKVLVTVGSVLHPMTPEHFIEWISIETNKGTQVKFLTPSDKPEASFMLENNETVTAVYAYCNLHSLWKNN